MRSRIILNLILLLVAAALATLFFMQPEVAAPTPEPVSRIDIDTVTSIRVERPEADTIELEKRDGDWRLTAPLQADAEDGRVGSVLLLAQSASDSRFPATDQKLDKFGLSPARLTLHFDDETFVVGDKNPLDEQQRYILHKDEIHLIDDHLYQRLNAPLSYYINPSLTPPDSRITRIRLPHGVIIRQDGNWHIIPQDLSNNPGKIAQAWQSGRATYLQKHDPLSSESGPEVTLEFSDHDSVSYRVIESSSAVVLARPDLGIQYHLRDDMAEKLMLVKPENNQNPDPGQTDESAQP